MFATARPRPEFLSILFRSGFNPGFDPAFADFRVI
jgi:hypothetical protein